MAFEDRAKFEKAIGQIIASAWDHEDFSNELTSVDDYDSLQALCKKNHISLPALPGAAKNARLKFIANTKDVRYVVIPLKPTAADSDLGLFAQWRSRQIVECCCFQSLIENAKNMIDEAFEQAKADAESKES